MIIRRLLSLFGFVLALGVLASCGLFSDPTGTLHVATTTTGDTLDPNGYTVTMAEIDTTSEAAGVQDTVTVASTGTVAFGNLPVAEYEIALSGIQTNCTPRDGTPQRVSVSADDTTEATFAVTCAPALLDRIVFTSEREGEAPDRNPEIYAIRPDGTGLRRLTHNADGWTTDRDGKPVVSPRGRRVAFISHRDNDREIYTVTPNGKTTARITHNDWGGATRAWDHNPAFVPTGSTMVYDSHRRRADGLGSTSALYKISLYGGEPTALTSSPPAAQNPAVSPDGDMIAYETYRSGNHDLSVMNADGSQSRRLTKHEANDRAPVWSPDGREIVFVSERNGNSDLYAVTPDGSGLTPLTTHDAADSEPTYCPGGGPVVFTSRRDGNTNLYALNPDDRDQAPTPLTDHEAADGSPICSPDGERVAFVSRRDGNAEIYTVATDGTGRTRVTEHPATDEDPHWSPVR
ncbi:hypothetical protein BSZ35_16055 [Salinibacter sp. 10B]|uniref:TolB family protein n=1 Tax=Salinibacter sp. 10B TaxID=1923971 RepID=UPI000CF3E36B|nr:LpqB family beta-propeller domain-containing protein [Salinibacter sp. 10B]PQJ35914.1 hypothetical protein BSZ35_16055 [Salinibacter sp. 10B]